MTELPASRSQKPTEEDVVRSLLKGYGGPGIKHSIATMNVLCRNLSHMNLELLYFHMAPDWCISTSAIQERTQFPHSQCTAKGFRKQHFIEWCWRRCGSIGLCAIATPRASAQHCLGLVCSMAEPARSDTMLLSEVWPVVDTSCCLLVYKVTPLNHLSTPLGQTNIAKASTPLQTLGAMFELLMNLVATTLQACVTTSGRALQGRRGIGSEWPLTVLGHTQSERGKKRCQGCWCLEAHEPEPKLLTQPVLSKSTQRVALWLQVITRWCIQRHFR